MNKKSLIRTIYLYLFSFIGLVLLVVSGVRFIDMGLKAFVFTKAEYEERIWYDQPLSPPVRLDKIAEEMDDGTLEIKETIVLEEDEIENIISWISDYNYWKEKKEKTDPVTSRRHREASSNVAMILIGLPLYLYHWRVIKRDMEQK